MTTTPKPNPWLAPALILSLTSLVFSGYTSYTHNDKVNEHRVTAVEVKVEGLEQRLNRIEDKLDALMRFFGMTPRSHQP